MIVSLENICKNSLIFYDTDLSNSDDQNLESIKNYLKSFKSKNIVPMSVKICIFKNSRKLFEISHDLPPP